MAKHPNPKRSVVAAVRTAEAAVPARQVRPSNSTPDHDKIARLAYEYWLARGCPDGSPEEDWFHAEKDLRQQGTEQRVTLPDADIARKRTAAASL